MPADSLTFKLHCPDDADIDNTLQIFDTYIFGLAKKQLAESVSPYKVLDLEIDELVQNTRIKLWFALRRRHIYNIKAYISCIVRTEYIDMLRRYKRTSLLFKNGDDELHQDAQDLFEDIENLEMAHAFINAVMDGILTLPPCQQHAMICSIKEHVADTFPIVEMFMERGLDIKAVAWPLEKKELQKLRASLSIARKKLRLYGLNR